VLLDHVRHFVLANLSAAVAPNLFDKAVFFMTVLGHEAVVVFFVISGYLVAGLSIVRARDRPFDFGSYAAHRFSRIYVVLIPALVIGWAFDAAGSQWVNQSGLYTTSKSYGIVSIPIVTHNLSITTFLGNLAMVEDILTPRLGSNGPLWSLVYEWWYYCLFGAAAVAICHRGWPRALGAVAFLVMAIWLPFDLKLWGLIWLLGAAVAVYGARHKFRPHLRIGGLAFVGALAASRLAQSSELVASMRYGGFLRDFALAIGYSTLLLSFQRPGPALPFANLHKRLAGFSYTLYLTHFPLVILCVSALYQFASVGFRQKPQLLSYGYMAALILLALSYSFVFSRLTEAHTDYVRKRVTRLLQRLRAGRASREAA